MIISHSKRFIFIKTRKTAGSTLQLAFAQACEPGDIFISSPGLVPSWGMVPDEFQEESPHVGKMWIRKRFLREWRGYTKITVERNPLDKVVSLYYWQTKNDDPRPSFETWFKGQRGKSLSDFELYGTRAGKVLADHVILYEDLQAEYDRVCLVLGLRKVPLSRNKAGIRPGDDNSFDHYTKNMLRRMKRVFHREIDAFGYSF